MKKHPLEWIVLEMANQNDRIDVSNVASRLSGVTVFHGRDASKGTKAYRVVAADVLGCMASAGRLEQHGEWGGKPEDGGPFFSVPNSKRTPGDTGRAGTMSKNGATVSAGLHRMPPVSP
ncbi:hypothetical protein CCR95_22805 [Thiocystis minor]|uniref:hypothetical protein n=1 Tax=Thiocystis minor TaxID=61597 RepID=UPI001911FC38|nr:hypothetical protein [Thiocystis minor]MBK5966824.1 hypothetical protein [Thiocystis minor]